MAANQALLVAVVSAVPPAVVGHLLHLAATPVPVIEQQPTTPGRASLDRVYEPGDAPLTAVTAPIVPPRRALPPIVYKRPALCRDPAAV